MKARDYAISLGLAKKGSRGRMSAEAIKAIEEAVASGKTFSDYGSRRVTKRVDPVDSDSDDNIDWSDDSVDYPPIKSRPVKHDFSQIWGIDTRGRSPIKIAFAYCSCCVVQVRYCSAKHPQLPAWIGGGAGLVKEPTESEMQNAYENANREVIRN